MAEEELRTLERRWRESGSVGDEAAYLRARSRAGDLDEEGLQLAAYLRHPAAAAVLGQPAGAPQDLNAWLRGLSRFSDLCLSRAHAAIGWRLRAVFGDEPNEDYLGGPLAFFYPAQILVALEEWILCPCPAHGEQSRAADGLGYQTFFDLDSPRHKASYSILYAGRCREAESSEAYVEDVTRFARLCGVTELELVEVVQRDLLPWALGEGDPVQARVSARRCVVVVEDEARRVFAMRRALGSEFFLRFYRRRWPFMTWAATAPSASLITLDYHLGSDMNGLDAALALAQVTPFAPVILHSSDSTGARGQEEVLREAGWTTERLPFDEFAWAAALARHVPPR